jgi:hypothetical protein
VGVLKRKKHHLEELLQEYRGVLQESKGIPPKKEVEDEINFRSYTQRIGSLGSSISL